MNMRLIGFFLDFSGPIALLGLLLWLRSLKDIIEWPNFRGEWPLAALALLSSAIIFLSVSVDFKVLSDETNLLSVANMLTLFGKASNTELVTHYYHLPHALNFAMPTRPVLFPVLISLVQHAVGVHHWAPFVVNFALTFVLFWLTLHWARRMLSASLSPVLVSTLALLMSPVLAIVATSAGYDLCSLVFAFALFLLLGRYNEKRDARTLQAIFYGMVCFASVRYESIAAFPLLVLGLVLFERLAWIKKVSAPVLGFVALLLLPLVLQRYLTWGNFENPPGVPAFSLSHLWHHLPVFLRTFFLDPSGPYPILLHWLGMGGLLLSLRTLREYGWLPLCYGLFLVCLLLAHHFGFADHPTQARLFLPLSFALGLCGLYCLSRLEKWSDPRAILAIFLLLFVHHHQYAVSDPLSTQLTMTREMRHIRVFLAKDDHRDDLIVYDRPGQLSALGFSAVSWTYFNEHRAELLLGLKNRLYQKVIAIDRVRYDTLPGKEFVSGEGYRLNALREHQLSPDERLRLSQMELN
ncbi:MAG: hypothetical protein AB7K68_10220 [Bacteriovoracia bacterium]